jgi:hypothetical protein
MAQDTRQAVKPKFLREPLSPAALNKIIKDGKRREATEPRAVSAHYDRAADLIVARLRSGVFFIFPRTFVPGLKGARRSQIEHMELVGNGASLEWPDVDDGIDLVHLIERSIGLKTTVSAGRNGGRAKTKAKAAAARVNGAKGGRPKKKAAVL